MSEKELAAMVPFEESSIDLPIFTEVVEVRKVTEELVQVLVCREPVEF